MSYKVAARAKKKLSTKTVAVDVLGGSEDYTADSYGFKNVDNGLKSSYAAQGEPTGECRQEGVNHSFYLAGTETAVAWDGKCNFNVIGDDGAPIRYRSMDLDEKPFLCYMSVRNKPSYVLFAGTRFVVLPDNVLNNFMRYRADCGVFHDGRLFTTHSDFSNNVIVRWTGYGFAYENQTGPDYVDGVDGSGKVTLPAECGKIVAMLNYRKDIVLVREYGLSVMHALGDSRHFTLDKVRYGFEGKADIYGGVSCADRVWICTENDLYSFDGNCVKRVKLEEFMYSYTFKEISAFRDDYLYLTVERDGEKCFAEYEIESGKCAVFGRGINTHWRTGNGHLCIVGKQIFNLSDGAEDALREWTSEKFDLGSKRLKTLKRLVADCGDGVEISVTAGGYTRCFMGSGEFTVGLTGSEFTFRVKGTGEVKKLTAEWEVRV